MTNDHIEKICSEYPLPRRRFIGWSEIWRENGTGTKVFHILFVRVWINHFAHSTFWFD